MEQSVLRFQVKYKMEKQRNFSSVRDLYSRKKRKQPTEEITDTHGLFLAENPDEDRWQNITPEKAKIRYHRSYRKLQAKSATYIFFVVVLTVLAIDTLIILYFTPLTRKICEATQWVLATVIPPQLIDIIPKGYIYDDVFIVTVPGRYPSLRVSIITAIVSLTILFIAISKKKAIEPKYVWLIFISFIVLVSALFFVFFSAHFPYTLELYSEMYIKTEIGIWLTIPVVLSFALLPFPIPEYKKIGVIFLTLGYSVLFSLVRYIVFLYLLRQLSYLYMALMFFMFGPFLDFMYIVGSYSLCITSAAVKGSKDYELWNWLQ